MKVETRHLWKMKAYAEKIGVDPSRVSRMIEEGGHFDTVEINGGRLIYDRRSDIPRSKKLSGRQEQD